ncbi:MAG: cysteine--tRNA ligase [Alphaproteobacteria bacterium]|nr:cysteine--tRNA ligase [Alphaproteobacteria bacterium]
MTFTVFNTLTRRKEPFVPLDENNVRMYVCGPTVYDRAHIGNARPIIVFDTLYRLLKHLYPKVTYVRNITDVDDKIIKKSQESGEPINVITEKTSRFFHEDIAELNALPPDIEPRATQHIAEMIDLVKHLVDNGCAYEAQGHVLFSVSKMKNYGALSGRSMDEMIAGARVEVAPYKKEPGDFILWKPSDETQPGWDSPWGFGRPGWHLECSAMSSKYLGETFDIHGGGQDLIFPHHENEIAQSCCAFGHDFYAKYWLHNGHLMVNGEKMSKSLGNFFTIREILDQVPGEAFRLYTLGTHYHQPLNWLPEGLKQAKQTMDRFYTALRSTPSVDLTGAKPDGEVVEALKDDLNTPKAIAVLHSLATALNKAESADKQAEIKKELIASAHLMGLLYQDPEEWFRAGSASAAGQGIGESEIEALIQKRTDARKAKDFATADAVRKELADKGVIIEDTPAGTQWKRA